MIVWLGSHNRSIQVAALVYAVLAGAALAVLGALASDWISVGIGVVIVGLGVGNLAHR